MTPEYVSRMPLTEQARKDLLRIYGYQDFLLKVARVDRQVLWFFQHFGEGNFCVGADATPAFFAWMQGQPGFAGFGFGTSSCWSPGAIARHAARPASGGGRSGRPLPGR